MYVWSRRSLVAGVLAAGYVLIAVGGSSNGRFDASPSIVGGLLMVVGVAVVLWNPEQLLGSSQSHVPGLSAALVLLPLLVVVGRAWPFGLTALIASIPLVLMLLPSSRQNADRLRLFAVILAIVPLALIPAASTGLAEQPDVLMSHQAAGDAISAGLNPYVSVSVDETSPAAPQGSTVVGYPYPPATLMPFAVAAMMGNAAWLTPISLSVITGWLAFVLLQSPYRRGGLSLAAMHAAMPASLFFVFIGSTEPLSVLYFVASASTYRRRPVLSAVFFGIAIASKQYFAYMLVALLLTRIEGRLRYAAIATGTAAITYVPFLLVDAGAVWEATVAGPLDRWVIRTDSLSVAEFGIFVPSLAILGAVLLTVFLLGRQVKDMASLYLIGAAAMVVIAALSPQSFANYWYVVVAFMLIAIATRWRISGGESSVPAAVSRPSISTDGAV